MPSLRRVVLTCGVSASTAWAQGVSAPPARAASLAAAPSTAQRVSRWLELSRFGFATRYMHVANSAEVTTVTQVQHRQDLTGRLKFDAGGRVGLNFWLNSGRRFTAGWNETAVGPRPGNVQVYLKHLALSVKPIQGVDVQYGGFDFLRGQHTEVTTYNNDGFLTGQRVVVKRPAEAFFDEIAATYGYLGDLNVPDVNKRFHRLGESNYHQFLVGKTLGKRAAMSVDYTSVAGAETWREAIKASTSGFRLADALRLEGYQRTNATPGSGFALLAEKAVTKKLNATYGYTQIDRNYGNVNADKVYTGKHLYLLGAYALTPEWTFQLYHGRLLEQPVGVLPVRTRTEIVLRYNLLRELQQHGWFTS